MRSVGGRVMPSRTGSQSAGCQSRTGGAAGQPVSKAGWGLTAGVAVIHPIMLSKSAVASKWWYPCRSRVANDHTLAGHTNGVVLIGEKSIHRLFLNSPEEYPHPRRP
jgi:hypothetical protein